MVPSPSNEMIPLPGPYTPVITWSYCVAIKSYNEPKYLFKNINLNVTDGAVILLKGPSGSGKTSLLKCIARMESFDSGQMLLDGM